MHNQEKSQNSYSWGVSIESASYIENNNLDENDNNSIKQKIMKRNILQNYFLKIKVIKQMKIMKKIKTIMITNNYLIKI